MLPLFNYKIFIFDCDGVILDSNELKITAMEIAVSQHLPSQFVDDCVSYFRGNFGKSRYHHVQYFVENIAEMIGEKKEQSYKLILDSYASQCYELYMKSSITEGFMEVLRHIDGVGKSFVASGSDQTELQSVFENRGLSSKFISILGSPASKQDNIRSILQLHKGKAVMFGDSSADLEAARINKIDFIAYLPLSNNRNALTSECSKNGYPMIENWVELLYERK